MAKNIVDAILKSDVNEVKRLQLENPMCIDERYEGITLPNLAAKIGDLSVFKYLVEYSRASFNDEDENCEILFYAVESGNVELVKYIVERVGISALDGKSRAYTPYEYAVELGKSEVVDYFSEKYGKYEDMYKNPIRCGMHPDPSICVVGDDFYMANSSFIFFPCIPISHSKDLIHWEVIGHAITNPEWAKINELEGGRGYWAPDISYYEGRFYVTATYRLNDTSTTYRLQMVTSSDKPEGPYDEPVFIDEDGIDPSIFNDDDGRRYMLLNRGARLFEISKDAKEKISEARLLYYGSQKRAPEGSHLIKKDGYYYLFQAEGGTGEGHRITVARSESLFGVYEPCPYNPIMRQNNAKGYIQRCGHGKPVCTPNGEWYIPYLCGRQLEGKYSLLGRETALDKITWTPDGWPIVNELKGPSMLAPKPNLKECIYEEPGYDFDKGLSKEWSFVRVPEKDAYYIENGVLHLKSGDAPLSSMYSRNILVRKQKSFDFTFNMCMKLNVPEGKEAGVTCYYDENTYLIFSVRNEAGKKYLVVEEHIGHEDNSAAKVELTDALVIEFKIDTKGLLRSFSYRLDESKNYIPVTELTNVYYLCDEGIKMGKRFTGAMIGIYGDGEFGNKEALCR